MAHAAILPRTALVRVLTLVSRSFNFSTFLFIAVSDLGGLDLLCASLCVCLSRHYLEVLCAQSVYPSAVYHYNLCVLYHVMFWIGQLPIHLERLSYNS